MTYKGEIADFPQEVVEKMLERQVEQGNKRDASVFEKKKVAGKNGNGFTWSKTLEGDDFWRNIIEEERFEVFFKKYPSNKFVPFPEEKVMLVRDNHPSIWVKRVVFGKKGNRFLAWNDVETLEKTNDVYTIASWLEARDVEEEQLVHLTIQDISDGKGKGVPKHLIRIKDE